MNYLNGKFDVFFRMQIYTKNLLFFCLQTEKVAPDAAL